MLTETQCKNVQPSNKERKLFDFGGLYLLITPTGGKYWKLKYSFLDQEKKLSLGDYPLISLREAREKRDEAKKLLDSNVDPSFHKKEIRRNLKLEHANTFELIGREWHDNVKGKWSESYADMILRRMEADIFPKLGKLPIRMITPPVLLNALKQIENRGVFETTKRARQYCSQIFRYAVATGRADKDVSVDIIGAFRHVKVEHHAALDVKDLPEFLDRLRRNEARLYLTTRLAVELLLLTFVRTSELLEATWEEFDLEGKVWVIPAERMKMRKGHIVPLSNQVLVIMNTLKNLNEGSQYILPNQIATRKPMSNNTILYALYRLGYKGKTTGHGFRALAMTAIKENLGYRHEVVDRQLAHAHRNSVDAAYDRAQFLKERVIMMQEWANYIENLKRP